MQDVLDPVEPHPHSCPRHRLHCRTQVVEEGLNLAPMNVSAGRLAKDGANQVLMFMAHGRRPFGAWVWPNERCASGRILLIFLYPRLRRAWGIGPEVTTNRKCAAAHGIVSEAYDDPRIPWREGLVHQIAIRSGGQTGVDRAALDFARTRGLEYRGWCPKGGWAEDQFTPLGLLLVYPNLMQTPCTAPEQRTAWNARDSDATLILVPAQAPIESFGFGTMLAHLCARLIFEKPCCIIDLESPDSASSAAQWLSQVSSRRVAEPFDLNIAGPRESQAPGVYAATLRFLDDLWRALGALESARANR